MKYDEYLKCALKHLKGCQSFLKDCSTNSSSDYNVMLELYYLAGYILEGIVVYSAYKLNNWPSNKDIQYDSPDFNFTKATGLDFYYNRCRGNVAIFSGRTKNSLSVQGHHFQPIVQALLKKEPAFNNIPYLGNGAIDSDVENLIIKWEPELRYCYKSSANPLLNKDIIERLLNTCETIYINHI